MKSSRILWKIIRDNNMDKFVIMYFVSIIAVCFVLMAAEPQIKTFGDALWYVFALVTSTGFGDLTAVTVLGRTTSIILGIYSIFVIALLTALVIDFYQEKLRIRQNESILMFLDKLEHLPELSPQELAQLSEKVIEKRKKLK